MADNDNFVFELDDEQIEQLLSLANLQPSDVFYDIGSGHGKVIIQAVKLTQVKRAIGIEVDRERHEAAVNGAIDDLSKEQLKRTGFWFGSSEASAIEERCGYQYELDDATVIYNSTDETLTTVDDFDEQLDSRPLKIITKNLPFVGYESVAANRINDKCWFFLTQYPFTPLKDLAQWAASIKEGWTIEQVYDYYIAQVRKQYPDDEKNAMDCLLEFKQLVNERFD